MDLRQAADEEVEESASSSLQQAARDRRVVSIDLEMKAAGDTPVNLKTLRLDREFFDEYDDLHRRDAVAMER